MATLYFTGTCDVVVTDGVAKITPTTIYNDAGVAVSTLYTRIKTGDRINCSAGCGIVAAVAADGTITSTDGWYGTTAAGVKFNAQPMPAGSELATSTRDALAWKNTLNSLVCVRAGEASAVKELQKLDCLVGLYFTSMALIAPPSSYAAGATYLVGASATGLWAGYDGKIAYSRDGAAWEFYAPYNGLTAYNTADGRRYRYSSGAWAADDAMVSGHAVSVSGTATDGTLYSLSFTLSGATAVTFPTSGTVAVLEKAQTWAGVQTYKAGLLEDVTGAAYHNLNGTTTESFYNVFNAAMPSGSRRGRFGLNTGSGTLCIDMLSDDGNTVTGRVTMTSTGILGTNAVKFPATQVASTDANTLDDYEEGTWTPVLTAATAPAGVTYQVQSGRYVKIGSVVHLFFGLKVSSVGSGGAGVVRISGLPFAQVGTGSYSEAAVLLGAQGGFATAANAGHVGIFVATGSAYIEFRLMSTNGDTEIPWSEITTSTFLGREIVYIASA